MSSHERGRSTSASRASHLNTTSASPHRPLDPTFAGTDNSISNPYNLLGTQSSSLSNSSFGGNWSSQQSDYALGQTYGDFDAQQSQSFSQMPLGTSQENGNITGHTFLQSQGFAGQGNAFGYEQGAQGGNHTLPNTGAGSGAFSSFDFGGQQSFEQSGSVDPSLLSDEIDLLSQQNNADMATMHAPIPPHFMPDMTRRHSGSPSPQASPNFQQTTFGNMNRPRNTSESLDPSSAMYPQGQPDWSRVYSAHRRQPSDQLSDVSSHSNQASPYMGTLDAHSSPLLNSQDPTFNDGLGLGTFSLNENHATQQSFRSPGHSPHISPSLLPQQHALPQFTQDDNFGLNNFNQQQQNQLDMFPGMAQEAFPAYSNQPSPGELGIADQMSPPTINVDFAGPQVHHADNARPSTDGEALSPPMRSPSRNRSKSDPYSSRSSSPGVPARGRSPSLQPSDTKLSPFDNTPSSRSPSPSSRNRNGSLSRPRSSSNASENREYLLRLAEPESSVGGVVKDNGRVQKHPANFQCHLCPKRFTRAYNLRSHLRTHTDERPFVCTICGKAFARQHDRKRHEGLHSGEKKFVCKGNLTSGAQWGCGRRFARADALGRHFRSEAGRVCIKPLLDEEAAERQKVWMEEQQQAQVAAGYVAPQPMMAQPNMDIMGNFLPAALLQQYPALATIDWNTLPQGPPPPEDDYSGRSSFDASSGGEYYDDMSENEMGSDMGPYQDQQMMNQINMQQGMGMQAQSGAQGYGGYQTGDYLSDFEGR